MGVQKFGAFTLTGDESGVAEADDRADFAGLGDFVGDLVGDLEPTKDGGSRDVPHDGPEDGLRSPSVVLMSSNKLSSTVSPEI